MVYSTYNYSIHGAYKPTYNWGASHCMYDGYKTNKNWVAASMGRGRATSSSLQSSEASREDLRWSLLEDGLEKLLHEELYSIGSFCHLYFEKQLVAWILVLHWFVWSSSKESESPACSQRNSQQELTRQVAKCSQQLQADQWGIPPQMCTDWAKTKTNK